MPVTLPSWSVIVVVIRGAVLGSGATNVRTDKVAAVPGAELLYIHEETETGTSATRNTDKKDGGYDQLGSRLNTYLTYLQVPTRRQ